MTHSARQVPDPSGEQSCDHPAAGLRSVVVTYEDRLDRCTVCPRDATREEFLVT